MESSVLANTLDFKIATRKRVLGQISTINQSYTIVKWRSPHPKII